MSAWFDTVIAKIKCCSFAHVAHGVCLLYDIKS